MYNIINVANNMLIAQCPTLEIAKDFIKEFKKIDKMLYSKACKYKIIKKEVWKMINNVILVGRAATGVITKENENGKKKSVLTLAVRRQYRNKDGIFETDFIRCIVWEPIISRIIEVLRVGDAVSLKGRLQLNDDDQLELIAEKIIII